LFQLLKFGPVERSNKRLRGQFVFAQYVGERAQARLLGGGGQFGLPAPKGAWLETNDEKTAIVWRWVGCQIDGAWRVCVWAQFDLAIAISFHSSSSMPSRAIAIVCCFDPPQREAIHMKQASPLGHQLA
jgi:hypothetical protein